MSRRKTIALLNLMPETTHGNNIARGVFGQCQKYGYNVASFASMTPLSFYYQDYADGERAIYDLPDYSSFDGIVIDAISLTDQSVAEFPPHLAEMLKAAKCPIVCMGAGIGDHKVIQSSNEFNLREIVRHVVCHHGKRDIIVLTGPKGNHEAEDRLTIFLDELEKLGVNVPEENIVYGNFWFDCGTALADEILSGKRKLPEAVIAASDHMALGLVDRLSRKGIKIPEQMIAVGFEATQEALLGEVSLSSFESNFTKTAADAVDYVHSIIDPDVPLQPYEPQADKIFHPAMSCGCQPDLFRAAKAFKDALYYRSRNFDQEELMDNIDIGLLMENYMSEILTSSETPDACMENIYHNSYLTLPFLNFGLCLREDWLTASHSDLNGFTDKMILAVANSKVGDLNYHEAEKRVVFDRRIMHPALQNYTEDPCVFYFSAVHYSNRVLGYTMLQRKLTDRHILNLVFRNWLRNVNSALQMVRTRNRYVMLSIRDNMTGLYNRRGMYERFEKIRAAAKPEDRLFTAVIDMDGLKYVNDTFGHNEGDYGINAVSRAAQQSARTEEFCVRAGGDEFYVIGIGSYADDECEYRCAAYLAALSDISANSGKPYPISASIGCALSNAGDFDLEELLRTADEEMYRFKVMRKKHRQ
ncbi:GGDEF domain-containing protein [Ruminococcus sp.]|uniref:substrate-binding and GGDEF domain-containing protein n=1 Tax=Ruminococcus sp. TaxID=41978 RepID=UPI0025EF1AAA|nr:GGDEF domain-containing protein [Ruminococcus sp.]MBQ9543359.1 GGDEF domain-containing protein [Ruminococcus sp.]